MNALADGLHPVGRGRARLDRVVGSPPDQRWTHRRKDLEDLGDRRPGPAGRDGDHQTGARPVPDDAHQREERGGGAEAIPLRPVRAEGIEGEPNRHP